MSSKNWEWLCKENWSALHKKDAQEKDVISVRLPPP
jgi:hypothetical protein